MFYLKETSYVFLRIIVLFRGSVQLQFIEVEMG